MGSHNARYARCTATERELFYDRYCMAVSRVNEFVRLLAAKGSQTMPVLSTLEAQLSLHEHYISQKHRNAKKPAANYKPAKFRNCWCYSTLCRISEYGSYEASTYTSIYLSVLARLVFRRFEVRLVWLFSYFN